VGKFDGQVAIVTGGASGIGGATSRHLAAEGARVLIADINDASGKANADRIRKTGGVAEALHVDVGVPDDIKRMVGHAATKWGRIDILVQNAFPASDPNSYVSGSAVDVPEDRWDWGMSVLVKALYLGARHAVPVMARNGRGNIINISSVHGLLAAAGYLVYETGKFAVIGMTKQMACDFGPMGIRVNAICPGHIVTEGMAELWKDHPGGLDYFANQYPLRRTGTPDDIANAIGFLCSDAASFITGHALAVDGGLTVQLQENMAVRQTQYARDHPSVRIPFEMA
jgi:NAD(P)-dependent dehydrogenase (short-subunit alcohol dehydrogenase family)